MKKTQDQAALLRRARKALGKTNEELAEALGMSLSALYAWLAPTSAAKHRTMPQTAKLLLERLVAESRGKR